MAKLHLWKSELALCISAIEKDEARIKPQGVTADLYNGTLKKLNKAYNLAER